jgi:hypothetical protein
MNGKMIGKKPLYVAIAQRREERMARLQVIFITAYFSRQTITFLIFVSIRKHLLLGSMYLFIHLFI